MHCRKPFTVTLPSSPPQQIQRRPDLRWMGLMMFLVLQHSTSVVNAECDPDYCDAMLCVYGRAYDSNGCISCDCLHPCEEVQCSDTQQCQAVRVGGCDGIQCSVFKGVCKDLTETLTKPPCPDVNCSKNTCRFGSKTINGCQTCQCSDPCEEIECLTGFVCQMSADDCQTQTGVECRDSPMPYCVDVKHMSKSSTTEALNISLPTWNTGPFQTSSAIQSTTATTTLLVADGLVEINASFTIVDDKEKFKKYMQLELSSWLGIPKDIDITIDGNDGAVLVHFILLRSAGVESENVHFQTKNAMSDVATITYNGQKYPAKLVRFYTHCEDSHSDLFDDVNRTHYVTLLVAGCVVFLVIAATVLTSLTVCSQRKHEKRLTIVSSILRRRDYSKNNVKGNSLLHEGCNV